MKQKNKAFTLIELIVVMAVIAILVLLATPRFLTKTQEAKTTKIMNDVKVVEGVLDEYLIQHDTLPSAWTEKPDAELQALATGGNLYDFNGLLDTIQIIETGPYKLLENEILKPSNTKLNGKFYGNDKGKVYYEDTVANVVGGRNP